MSLAEIVLRDLLDDGLISIYRVSGEKVGDFPADPELLAAVRAYPACFRAGVLGPDAYPDIATGQCIIHPEQSQGGSNAWLEYLWGRAKGLPAGPHRQQCLAWTCGFLVHAAGDMYAHDYINQFSGGDFELGQNAIKHIVLEGHVASRTEMNFPYDASIAGIEDFIYDTCVNAADNPDLRERLLIGPETSKSIPAEFSALRRKLDSDIAEYYRGSRLNPIRAAQCTYKEHWRDDIMQGLRAWPATSHAVACALFFNAAGTARVEEAQAILERYAKEHLLSMAGAPDAAGKFLSIADEVAEAVLPKEALARLKRWKNNLLLELVQSGTGIDLRMYKQYMGQPDSHFDQFLGMGSVGSGRKINMADFDAQELGLSGLTFDYHRFRPAYNTVAMTRLIFLSRESVNGVLAGLGSNARLTKDNAMLGFVAKLDGSRQWDGNAEKMVVASDPVVYTRLFFP